MLGYKLSSPIGENITGQFDANYIKEKKLIGDKGIVDIWAEKDGVKARISLQYKIDIVLKTINFLFIEADKTSIVDSEVATFKITGKYNDGTPLSKEDLNRVTWISNKPDGFIISRLTGQTATGKLSQEYFKKFFNKDFSGELIVTAILDRVSQDVAIKYKSTELENKNIILTITSDKEFLKDKERATLTVTGKYKDGKTVSDEVLSKVKWVSNDSNIYLDKVRGLQGKTITIKNCDTSGDIIPIELSAFAIKEGSDILNYDIEFPRPEYPSPVIIDDKTINSKITAYLEDEAVWSEIIIKCDIPTRRQDDPIWGRVEDPMGTTNEFKIDIKKENSNPREKKIGYSLQTSLMPTAIVASVVGEKVPLINTEFKYDLNGNLIAKIVNSELIESYGYNEFNQLISYSNKTTGKNFTYDYYANGQRKSKCGDGQITSFLYDGENIIIELGNDGKLKNRYSIGHNYLSKEESSGNKYYYCYDAHGDVKLLTDGVGNVVKNYVYDIYGREDKPNGNEGIENSIRYAGQYYDAESGLYYLRARYYSPEIMRFISEDTYRGKIEEPLSLNYYSYCEGNPVRYIDPSGNIPIDIIADIGFIAWDILDIISDPKNGTNWKALTADAICEVVPYATGAGRVLKVGAKGIEATKKSLNALSKAEKVATISDGKIIMAYRHLKSIAKGTGLEVHHLIEKRFADTLGLNANDILSIAIDKETHREITNLFRKEIGYDVIDFFNNDIRTSNATAQEIWSATKNVYRKMGMNQYIDIIWEQIKTGGKIRY